MLRTIRCVAALILIAQGADACANQDPDELYAAAVAAYRDERFLTAAVLFEKVLALGRSDGNIYYNLGSVYYRLGQFDRSAANYERASAFPDAQDLSWYNLGLIALQQKQWPQAEHWFERVEQSTRAENLRVLSEIALARVRSEIEAERHVHLRIGSGYTSNVLGLSDATLSPYAGQGATLAEAQGSYESRRFEFSDNRVRATTALYGRWHAGKEAVDIAIASQSLAASRDASHGEWQIAGWLGQIWYGGARFQRFEELTLTRTLGFESFEARLSYDVAWIDGLSGSAAGQAGTRRTLSIDTSVFAGRSRVNFGGSREGNDREASAESPTRNEIHAGTAVGLSRRLMLTARWGRRTSGYPRIGGDARHDRRNRLEFELQHYWQRSLYGSVALHYVDNRSTNSSFSYTQTTAMLSVGMDL